MSWKIHQWSQLDCSLVHPWLHFESHQEKTSLSNAEKEKILLRELFSGESGLRFHCIVPTRASNIDEWSSVEVTSPPTPAGLLHFTIQLLPQETLEQTFGVKPGLVLRSGGVDSQRGGSGWSATRVGPLNMHKHKMSV